MERSGALEDLLSSVCLLDSGGLKSRTPAPMSKPQGVGYGLLIRIFPD